MSTSGLYRGSDSRSSNFGNISLRRLVSVHRGGLTFKVVLPTLPPAVHKVGELGPRLIKEGFPEAVEVAVRGGLGRELDGAMVDDRLSPFEVVLS